MESTKADSIDASGFAEHVKSVGSRCIRLHDESAIKDYVFRLAEETRSRLVVCDRQRPDLFPLHDTLVPFDVARAASLSRNDFFRALKDADIGVSSVDLADTGTVIIATDDESDRLVTALPRTHVAIVHADRPVSSLDESVAFLEWRLNGSSPITLSLISASSRTADIGDMVILGAHGPKELHILLVDKESSQED